MAVPEDENTQEFIQRLCVESGACKKEDVDECDMGLPSIEAVEPSQCANLDIDWEHVSVQSRRSLAGNALASSSARTSRSASTHSDGLSPCDTRAESAWKSVPYAHFPKTVMLAPETTELLKTAISSDLQVKISIQLSSIHEAVMNAMKTECRALLNEIKEEVRTLKRRKRS